MLLKRPLLSAKSNRKLSLSNGAMVLLMLLSFMPKTLAQKAKQATTVQTGLHLTEDWPDSDIKAVQESAFPMDVKLLKMLPCSLSLMMECLAEAIELIFS